MNVKILKTEKYPNCAALTVEAEVDGVKVTERFKFGYAKIASDEWKNHIKRYFEKMAASKKKADTQTDATIDSLQGKTVTL